jgi:hypothetical protein
MQKFQRICAAVLVAGTMVALSSAAEARHRHYADSQAGYVCGPIMPPASLYIYPSANWEPFFWRHLYRFGPIVACERSTVTPVLSVRS